MVTHINQAMGKWSRFWPKTERPYRLAYEAALRYGGVSEGPPGVRPEYHANYYGTYFRDPEGNKICVASHGEE